MNLDRLAKSKKAIDVESEDIYDFARKHYKELHKSGKTTWNGRQIKNAFQTAIALAEFDANTHQGRPKLKLEHFKVVAKAAEDFDGYLCRVWGGTEGDLAKRYAQRDDDPVDARSQTLPYSMAGLKASKKRDNSSSSSSSSSSTDDSDAKAKRKRRKGKKSKRKGARTKSVARVSKSEDSSSESK